MANEIHILLKVRQLIPSAKPPVRSTPGSAGLDLFASESVVVPAPTLADGRISIGHALVPTGIAVAIPDQCVGKIGSRSGLSIQNNIEVGAGWVDSDYRGEIKVELKNLGPNDFMVEAGSRIAQLILLRTESVLIETVTSLPPSSRGAAGFGSTGL